jgi:integrase
VPRKANVRFFESRNAFYCQIDRKQYRLGDGPDDSDQQGPNYSAAVKAYGELAIRLHAEAQLARAGADGNGTICRVVLEKYMQYLESEKKNEPSTLGNKKRYGKLFLADFGETSVADLKRIHIRDWIKKGRQQRGWDDGTVRSVISCAVAPAFAWAVVNELTTRNPFAGLELPGQASAARKRLLATPELHKTLMARVKPWCRPILVCLRDTGCRPGELAKAETRYWHDEPGCLIYPAHTNRREDETSHKTGRKTDKDRIIYFVGESLAVMRQLVRLHPTGKLFRRPDNKTLNIAGLFQNLQRKLALLCLSAYSYRHAYATEYLENGGGIEDLAELLGTSPAVIRRHYSHLCQNKERFRGLAERFATLRAGKTESPSSTSDPALREEDQAKLVPLPGACCFRGWPGTQ